MFDKILEVTEKGFEETEHAIEQWNIHRHGAKLFLKLGIAVYAEQRLGGDHGPVERILGALDGHAAEHGEVDLDHLKAAHEVLGDEFIKAHDLVDGQPAPAAAAS
ncbi:hypothetical protein KGA66_02330 [Actinocrinis puniceicyclus]|uniref:Uncharacterized protein n=1 Tax=Actinocrinis puniceicyclus TaxID=977794 RepID=A0A8J8BAA0_9ACTN|nr:hypothetical protein [Actinocrinis puniceicyclus]MBS2961868.1 hypothetical protein [Actinocrinis puniceicyclus]